MAKTITLTDKVDDKEYTLEFNRYTVQEMEKHGFLIMDLANKPMTYLPQLFRGAFKKNHRKVTPAVCDRLFDAIVDKTGLSSALVEMYQEPIEAFLGNREEDEDEGNVAWGKSW